MPVNKTEYGRKTAQLIDESVFKLLTSPMYFNTQLHWQERRKILLEVCGDITDAEVIASDKALKELPRILQNRSLEGHRKVLAAQRAEINRELERIPVRISEVQHSLPDISQIQEGHLAKDIEKLRKLRTEKEQEKLRIQQGGEAAEKTKKLRNIEAELIRVQNEHRQQQDGQTGELRKKVYAVKNDRMDLESDIKSLDRQRNDAGTEIKEVSDRIEQLRQQWHEENKLKFTFQQDDTCPTCGQLLPRAQVEATREKALADFNQTKAKKLEDINAEGRRLKTRWEELDKQITGLTRELEDANQKLDDLKQEETKIQKQLDSSQTAIQPVTEIPEYSDLLKQKERVEAEIQELEAGNQEATEAIQAEIDEFNSDIAALEKTAAQVEQYHKGQERIDQLKMEEESLSSQYEQLEKELYLTEEFIRTKVRLFEEKINSKFEMARFKMFNQQINGGIEECCEVLYKGVPFSSLNNAARINIGLDIIRTLSQHYGASAPIFIDNAEAVVQLLDMDTQVIKLVVSGADKKLRVEIPGKQPTLFDGLEREAS